MDYHHNARLTIHSREQLARESCRRAELNSTAAEFKLVGRGREMGAPLSPRWDRGFATALRVAALPAQHFPRTRRARRKATPPALDWRAHRANHRPKQATVSRIYGAVISALRDN